LKRLCRDYSVSGPTRGDLDAITLSDIASDVFTSHFDLQISSDIATRVGEFEPKG
jgi:hypothetical protein